MEAAAKTVDWLSKKILPERPHLLSNDLQWRYRLLPPDSTRLSREDRFEEWYNTRLQYMTFVSHADRGAVFTRSYDDMREEPPKPVSRDVSALAKPAGEKKKKLSLSDYKNKKTGMVSASSTAADTTNSKPSQGDCSPPPAPEPPAAVKPAQADANAASSSQSKKPDIPKPDSQAPPPDAKQRPSLEGTAVSRLPPKPPSLPPKPPSPSTKKRLAEVDDELRPQKRPRPDERRPENRRPEERRYDTQRPEDRRNDNQRPEDRRLDNQRLDNQRPDDRRFDNQRSDDRRFDERRFDNHRPDERRLENSRPDDRRHSNQRFDDRIPGNQRADERRPDVQRPDDRRSDTSRADDRRPDMSRPDDRRVDNHRHDDRRNDHSRLDDRRHDDRRPPDRPQPPRDDGARHKERPLPAANSSRNLPPPKGDRSSSSSLPNGRPVLKGPQNAARSTSPGGRPRAETLNGVRPQANASSNGNHAKTAEAAKSHVPPLLSPLKLSFDGDSRSHPGDDANGIKDKRKRNNVPDAKSTTTTATTTAATTKANRKAEPSAGAREDRDPVVIPPLLSPTLPPAVEAELLKGRRQSPEPADERHKQQEKEAAAHKKKPPQPTAGGQGANKLGHRRRLLVTLAIPRALRASVAKLMGPPPSFRKDGPSHDRERGRERDPGQDRRNRDESSQANQARKRPAAASGDGPVEPAANKRPRTSDMIRVAAVPSTPSKPSTAMSRVSSSNSMAQTPGEGGANAAGKAPVAATPFDPPAAPAQGLDTQRLTDIENRLRVQARRLKHAAEGFGHKPQTGSSPSSSGPKSRENRGPKGGGGHEGSNGSKGHDRGASKSHDGGRPKSQDSGELEPDELNARHAHAVESTLAFMMVFHANSLRNLVVNNRYDPQPWESTVPYIQHIIKDMREHTLFDHIKPLYALMQLCLAVTYDEIVQAYAHLDLSKLPDPDIMSKTQRAGARLWWWVRDINLQIDSARMRVDAGPWCSIDDLTMSGTRVLREWCADNGVDWTPEPALEECWPIIPPPSRQT